MEVLHTSYIVKSKINFIDADLEDTKKRNTYAQKTPTTTLPFLETKNGNISESISIEIFLAKKYKPEILGSNIFEHAKINQWIEFANCEIQNCAKELIYPIFKGKKPENKGNENDDKKFKKYLSLLEKEFKKGNKFIMGNKLTLADIVLFRYLRFFFMFYLTEKIRNSLCPKLTLWFENIMNTQEAIEAYGRTLLCKKQLKPLDIKIEKNKNKNDIISNPLNLNIPIKLRIEIERNKKAEDIIEILKKMEELKLDNTSQFTEFIILGNNKYIKMDSLIDETFLNFEEVYVYELLNYEGIKKIFGYDDLKVKANPLNKQDIQSMLQIIEEDYDLNNNTSKTNVNKNENNKEIKKIIEINNANSENDKEKDNSKIDSFMLDNNLNINEISEKLIAVFHEYRSNSPAEIEDAHLKLFNLTQNASINNNLDFIILTNKQSIKPVDLYEMIWEKYMYFLNSPTKYESTLWWKPYSFSRTSTKKVDIIEENNEQNENDNNNETESININPRDYKRYFPFSIKLVKKATRACVFCPWFRLCQGCVLNPKNKNYLSISSDFLIIIEWRREVIRKDMKEENINYLLNHSSAKKIFESSQDEDEKKSIYDCLDLFTREEIMKNIFCEKCNKKTNFKKRLEIDKFPKYLTLILKRFKYTKMFTTKLDNLIHFPLENLDMTNYITPKEGKIKYDLFGVVNHVGTLSGGHYNCDIKQDNLWIKYDDSYTCEYDKKIMTENAYLLIYKLVETKSIYNEVIKHEFKLNLLGLMDTAYKIYLKQHHFEHFFNYVYENNKTDVEGIVEEFMTDCKYYYGEPITVNGKMGFLVNIYKNEETDKVYLKIKVKKGYYETNVSEKKIIKETVKISEESAIANDDEEKIKVPGNEEQSKVFCGSCIIA